MPRPFDIDALDRGRGESGVNPEKGAGMACGEIAIFPFFNPVLRDPDNLSLESSEIMLNFRLGNVVVSLVRAKPSSLSPTTSEV
jgi:hypothetical protein